MRRKGGRIGAVIALSLLAALVVAVPERLSPRVARAHLTLNIDAVPIPGARLKGAGPLTLAGAWTLRADAPEFHSLSGLAIGPGGRLVAVTDRGMYLTMPKPGESGSATMEAINPDSEGGAFPADAEAVVVDADGQRWIAVESGNTIERLAGDGLPGLRAAPQAMADWRRATGPESLARLPDGRFLVIGEGVERGSAGTFPALVFEGEPAQDREPWLFHIKLSDSYRPVEAAVLGDGRVLVLGRWFGLPFRFASALYLFDMREARPAGEVTAKYIGRIDGPGISDNFEGMAVEEAADGSLTIWTVSDSNDAQIIQSTILLKLETRKSAL